MSQTYHVFGAAVIQVGTGVAGALQTLGVTEDGADLDFETFIEPVRGDVNGPRVPVELQEMGAECWIRLRLVAWDTAVLNALLNRNDSGVSPPAGVPGTMGTPGRLVGSSGDAVRLTVIPGPAGGSEAGYYFPTAVVRNRYGFKAGTENGKFNLSLYAWPFCAATNTTGKGLVLFSNTVPSS